MTIDDDLAAFCEREHGTLVGVLSLYVGDRYVAEELAQDALVRLCQHWPRVRGMANPSGWLTHVAMNLARSMFRRRSAARRAMARHGDDVAPPAPDTASDLAVRDAVAGLAPRMREAVIHRYFLGASVAETAAAMGCAEGTVKALTHKALAALRGAGLQDAPTPQEVTR